MKKQVFKGSNIVIIILLIIIVILLYMLLHPSVVTQRQLPYQPAPDSISTATEGSENQEQTNADNTQKQGLIPAFRLNNEQGDSQYKKNSQNFNNPQYTPNNTISTGKLQTAIHVDNFGRQAGGYEQNYPPTPSGKGNLNNGAVSALAQTPITKRPKSLGNNLSVCEPYKETMTTEYMGMKMRYDIEIEGWVRGKCVLNFESSMLDAGDTFEKTYGFEPGTVDVVGFAPKIRCEFTQKQLRSVGDSFLLEEQKQNRKMLKDPNQIEIPELKDMTYTDIKLLKILLSDRACKVVNANDFIQMFQSLFDF